MFFTNLLKGRQIIIYLIDYIINYNNYFISLYIKQLSFLRQTGASKLEIKSPYTHFLFLNLYGFWCN